MTSRQSKPQRREHTKVSSTDFRDYTDLLNNQVNLRNLWKKQNPGSSLALRPWTLISEHLRCLKGYELFERAPVPPAAAELDVAPVVVPVPVAPGVPVAPLVPIVEAPLVNDVSR